MSLFSSFSILFYSFLIDKANKQKIIERTLFVSALLCLIFRFLLVTKMPILYYMLYIFAYSLWLTLYTEFWTLANDICDLRQAKRLYPLFITSGLVGGTISGFCGGSIVNVIHTENLIIVWMVMLLLALLWSKKIKKIYHKEAAEKKSSGFFISLGEIKEIASSFIRSPYMKAISLVFILYGITIYFLDYQYNFIISKTFTVEDKLTAFYNFYSSFFFLTTFLIQTFLVNRLIMRFGVGNMFLIFPSVVFSGFVFLMISFKFISAIYAKFSRDIVGNSIIETAYPLLFNPLPQKIRGRAMVLVEGLIIPIGIAFSGVILVTLIHKFSTTTILLISLIFSFLWLLSTIKLKMEYTRVLIDTLKDTSFDLQYLTARAMKEIKSSTTISTLIKVLEKEEENIKIFALEIISKLGLVQLLPYLRELLKKKDMSSKVRASLVKCIGSFSSQDVFPILKEYLDDPDDRVRANLLEILIENIEDYNNEEMRNILINKLADPSNRVKVLSAVGLAKLSDARGLETIKELYSSSDANLRAGVVYALGKIHTEESRYLLWKALEDPSVRVRLNAVKGIELSNGIGSWEVNFLLRALEDDSFIVHKYALQKLLKINDERVVDMLSERIKSVAKIKTKLNIIEELSTIRSEKTYSLVLELLTSDNELIREAALKSLTKMSETEMQGSKGAYIKFLEKEAILFYRNILIKRTLMKELPPSDKLILLLTAIADKNVRIKQRIIKAVGLLEGIGYIDSFFRWTSSETRRRAHILEFLDQTIDKRVAKYVTLILEGYPEEQIAKFAAEMLGVEGFDLLRCFDFLSQETDIWIRAVTSYIIGYLDRPDLTETLFKMLNDENSLVRENAVNSLKMYEEKYPDVVEKVRWANVLLSRIKGA
jgi:HEAT repeat protein/ATP/ADP translocase